MTKGIISRQAEQPRSYYVSTDHGELCRNRKHLQAIPGSTDTQHEQNLPDSTTDTEEGNLPMVPKEQLPEANQGTSVPSLEPAAAVPRTPQHIVLPKTARCGRVIRKPLCYQS